MLEVKCVMCDKELDEFGAIFLTSPQASTLWGHSQNHGQPVEKHHVCVKCEMDVLNFMNKEN
jgi:hypothetical protein